MSSIFAQHLSGQQNTGGGLFGSTNTDQNKPNLFGSLNTSTNTSQPPGTGLFGSTPAPQQTGGIFGSSQPQQSGGIFGSSQPAQTGGGIFGQPQQQNTQQGGVASIFSNWKNPNTQQSQQQQPPQQQQGSSIFGGLGQSAQQPQQNQHQGSVIGQGSVLGQSQSQSRLFQDSQIAPRQKSVIDQIELAFAKWNPASPQTLFQTYLYNAVPPAEAPFYGPGPGDDETRWEEALAKKPSAGAVPVAVRGFEQLAVRMATQYNNLNILRGRLHEINEGLNALLQKHELDISVRAQECKRKHQVLSKQCLGLAAKTQMLRNRGYAMDAAEEELRKKLLGLERMAMDPALSGRGEEIWARMVSVRERGRVLQREYERAGQTLGEGRGGVIDEEVLRRAKKILEEYNSQLEHLAKELESIQKDWAEYHQQEKPKYLMNGR